MNKEICDIKITVFDALLSAIKFYTSQGIKKYIEFQGKVCRKNCRYYG